MNTKLVTTKITPKALRTLRIVAAMTGERQYRLIERVLQAELDRKTQEEQRAAEKAGHHG